MELVRPDVEEIRPILRNLRLVDAALMDMKDATFVVKGKAKDFRSSFLS